MPYCVLDYAAEWDGALERPLLRQFTCEVVSAVERALVPDGEPGGLQAAMAIGRPMMQIMLDATHGGDGSACESVLVQTCTRRLFMFCDRLMSRTDAGQELSSFALPILLQRCTDILMVRY